MTGLQNTMDNLKFPDEYFYGPYDLTEYKKSVESGRQAAKKLNVLFCAACKDVAGTIKRMLDIVDYTGSLFNSYDIFLYENNSSDGTPDIIRCMNNPRVILQSEHIENAGYKRNEVTLNQRCNFIANARNKYVDYINANAGKYDYIFVFDTDIEGGWSYNGILDSINIMNNKASVGAVTSYCVLASHDCKNLEEIDSKHWMMFDSFAFRKYMSEEDFPNDMNMYNYIKSNIGMPPFLVDSNFNGLAIYRPECFHDNKYYVTTYGRDDHTDSEHVGFHKNIIKKGMSVVLNPSMVTSISKHKYYE